MLRTLLIASTLLAASGSALAYDGRVITVEPSITFSFGTRHHDGFRVLYEFGGEHYWTHTSYHPGHTIVLPPHHHQVNVYHHDDHGWRERQHWDGHPGRGHGRHHRKHHRFGHDD